MIGENLTLGIILIFSGVYFLVLGLTSKVLVQEEPAPTEDERARSNATPRKRMFCIALGIGCLIVGGALIWRVRWP